MYGATLQARATTAEAANRALSEENSAAGKKKLELIKTKKPSDDVSVLCHAVEALRFASAQSPALASWLQHAAQGIAEGGCEGSEVPSVLVVLLKGNVINSRVAFFTGVPTTASGKPRMAATIPHTIGCGRGRWCASHLTRPRRFLVSFPPPKKLLCNQPSRVL